MSELDSPNLQSTAWHLHGLSNTVGVLVLVGGQLAFATEDGVLFNAPLREVLDLTWPWYSFNAAFKATINGVRYHISFVKPNNAAAGAPVNLTDSVLGTVGGAAVDAIRVGNIINVIGSGMTAGKLWKAEISRQKAV